MSDSDLMAGYAAEMLHRLERMANGMKECELYYLQLEETTGLAMDVPALMEARRKLLGSLATYEDYLEQTLPPAWLGLMTGEVGRFRRELEMGLHWLEELGARGAAPAVGARRPPPPVAPAPGAEDRGAGKPPKPKPPAKPKKEEEWPSMGPSPQEVEADQLMMLRVMEMVQDSSDRRAARREDINEKIAKLRRGSLG